MWTTLDDLRLSIAPAALRRLAVRHRTSGLTNLVRRLYRASLLPAVRRAVGQLARGAYRTGSIRGRSGRRYPIFTAQVRGRSYMLVTRPLGRDRYTVVTVRPAPSSEAQLASYGGEVIVQWSRPMPLEQALRQDGGGVYILERRGVPRYVGEGQSFRDIRDPAGNLIEPGRLTTRATHLRQADVLQDYTVRLGTLPSAQNQNRPREMVEHTAILDLNAALAAQHLPPLTNQSSFRPYNILRPGVTIHHSGVVPPHLAGLRPDPTIPGGRLQHIPAPAPGAPARSRRYQPPTQLPLPFPPPRPRVTPPPPPPPPSPQLTLPFGGPASAGRLGRRPPTRRIGASRPAIRRARRPQR